MELSQLSYIKVHSVQEALLQMKALPDAIYVAGGTDVYVNKQQGNIEALNYIDITSIEQLKIIDTNVNLLRIGSLTTLESIIESKDIKTHFPGLIEAAGAIATPVIRKTATLGGNLLVENRCSFYNQSEWWRNAVGYCLKCNGDVCIATGGMKNCFSKFTSDTAPVLIAYQAKLVLEDSGGERTIPLQQLYSGDGVHSIAIRKDTLLKYIEIPIVPRSLIFKKLRPRKTLDFTSLTMAVSLSEKNDLCIVIGGVDPKPVVVSGNLHHDKLENLIASAHKKPRIVENDYYSRPYRKEMIKVFLAECLRDLGIQS